MTHVFLILAAVLVAGGILGGYSLAQRQPDPDDLDEPGLTDVNPAPHVGGWTYTATRYHATPLEPGWLTRHARSRKRTA